MLRINKPFIIITIILLLLITCVANVNATREIMYTDGRISFYPHEIPPQDSDYIFQTAIPEYINFVFIKFSVFNCSKSYPLIMEINGNITEIILEGVYSYIIQPSKNITIHLVFRTRYQILYSTTFRIIVKHKEQQYIPLQKYLNDLKNLEIQTILNSSILAILGLVCGDLLIKKTEVNSIVISGLLALPLIHVEQMPLLIPFCLSTILSYNLRPYAVRLNVLIVDSKGNIQRKKYFLAKDENYIIKQTPKISLRKKRFQLLAKKELKLDNAPIKEFLKRFGNREKYVLCTFVIETSDTLHIIGHGDITVLLTKARILEQKDNEIAKLKTMNLAFEFSLRQIALDYLSDFMSELTTTSIDRLDINKYYSRLEDKLKPLMEKLRESEKNADKESKASNRDGKSADREASKANQ
ncbi:MAG: hypothetical protein ACTSSP_09055 [Candidatus Asgardarchaeia archaeon]